MYLRLFLIHGSKIPIIKEDGGVIFIGVPNEFVRSWLSEKYHKTILKSLRDIVQTVRSIEYVVTKDKTNKKKVPDRI